MAAAPHVGVRSSYYPFPRSAAVWPQYWLCRTLRPQGCGGTGKVHHCGPVCQGGARPVTPECHCLGRARVEERLRTELGHLPLTSTLPFPVAGEGRRGVIFESIADHRCDDTHLTHHRRCATS